MKRMNIATNAPWEKLVGYSRAVRTGKTVEVSGTVAIRDNEVVGIGNPYAQTRRILEIINDVLQQAGGSINDIVRTRIYVTDITHWEEIGRAHGEVFGDVLPATTMIEVSQLIDPDCLVEIEATARIK